MKLTITTDLGEDTIVCDDAKIKDGFLQISNPEGHKELLLSLSNIKMIVVD